MKRMVFFLIVLAHSCANMYPGMVGIPWDSVDHGPWYIPTGSQSFTAVYLYPDSVVELNVQGIYIGSTLKVLDVFKWKGTIHCLQGMDQGEPYWIPQKDVELCVEMGDDGLCEPGQSLLYTELQWRQIAYSPIILDPTYVYDWHIGNGMMFYKQTAESLYIGEVMLEFPEDPWPQYYLCYGRNPPYDIEGWREIWQQP